jgi:hypothetical protein
MGMSAPGRVGRIRALVVLVAILAVALSAVNASGSASVAPTAAAVLRADGTVQSVVELRHHHLLGRVASGCCARLSAVR